MTIERRDLLIGATALVALGAAAPATAGKGQAMYGLIGKMTAAPGQRDALIAILLDSVDAMPGCLSYVVAQDTKAADVIWITEVWDSAASHQASLALPAVKAAIAKARSLIAGMEMIATTTPVGGHGLAVG
ncbi:MAG: superfamily monooxygenase protein [Caulobacter sp.]|nr:superfamily monooxygenase protein [Caulobacter sp.]